VYVLSPLAAVLLVAGAPAEVTELPVGYALALLLVGLPWLFIVLIVLPFAGLVSLYASWHATRNAGARIEARVTLLILISQLAGGVLGLIVVPLVRAVFPGSALVTAASVLLVACGLLMPLAFAVGVWRDHVLSR
jgi:hypothetical protein